MAGAVNVYLLLAIYTPMKSVQGKVLDKLSQIERKMRYSGTWFVRRMSKTLVC